MKKRIGKEAARGGWSVYKKAISFGGKVLRKEAEVTHGRSIKEGLC